METKQRRTLMIRVIAGLVIVLALAFAGWMLFGPSKTQGPKQSQLGPSDSMMPKSAPTAVPKTPGLLTINPLAVDFTDGKPDTKIVSIKAEQGAVEISAVHIPTSDADVIKVANLDCPETPNQLAAGQNCNASVTWNGQRDLSTSLTISYLTAGPTGQQVTKTQNVAISTHGGTAAGAAGTSGAKGQTAGAGNGTGAGGDQAGQNGTGQQVNQLPQQQGTTQNARGNSPAQQLRLARNDYLAHRQGVPVQFPAPQQLLAAARSPYTSWDNIGVQASKSSFPVDMSRVITPDKPLTAVLTYQIDTRQTVTAVAMVDRDVYGGNGRTVVVPRGTKIIGRVGGGATDRVGIAWSQIIRPDGVRFVFQGESGDSMGRGGVPGRINNRYLERYGYSLLPSLVGAGITAALGGQTNTSNGASGTLQTQDAKAVAAQILQPPLTQIANDIYQKKKDIPIQITIPAGTRVTIWSTGDLRLKPLGDPDTGRGETTGNQNGQNGLGARTGGYQRTSAAASTGGGQTTTGQTGSTQNQASNDGGDAEGNAALQVGRVDANGNYIPPGSNAPSPGPLVTNTNNGARNALQQQQQSGTTTNAPRTGFPAASNPWQ